MDTELLTVLEIDPRDPRDVRALQLSAVADQWEHTASGAFRMRSQTRSSVSHTVTPVSCTCQDARLNRCKHQRAAAIHLKLLAMDR